MVRIVTFAARRTDEEAHVVKEPGMRAKALCGHQPPNFWERLWVGYVADAQLAPVCQKCREELVRGA